MSKAEHIAVHLIPRLLDRRGMAACLSLSEDTLDALRKQGLPCIHVPGSAKILFCPDDCVDWLKTQSEPRESLTQATAKMKADKVFGN